MTLALRSFSERSKSDASFFGRSGGSGSLFERSTASFHRPSFSPADHFAILARIVSAMLAFLAIRLPPR
jgi:hypothetical protein